MIVIGLLGQALVGSEWLLRKLKIAQENSVLNVH